jgi:protein-disulfide isomerase
MSDLIGGKAKQYRSLCVLAVPLANPHAIAVRVRAMLPRTENEGDAMLSKDGWSNLLVGMAVVSAAAISLKAILGTTTTIDPPEGSTRVIQESWADVVGGGHVEGPDTAPLRMVVFGDYECQYCRTFALETMPRVRAKYGNDIQVVYRHFPLPQHRFAIPAARAVICADRQERYAEMSDQLYGLQDSLGFISFEEIAARSDVPDLPAFGRCYGDLALDSLVQADFILAREIGVSATPTIAINGLLYLRPLTESQLLAEIDGMNRTGKAD